MINYIWEIDTQEIILLFGEVIYISDMDYIFKFPKSLLFHLSPNVLNV